MDFANTQLLGTLGATVVIDRKTERKLFPPSAASCAWPPPRCGHEEVHAGTTDPGVVSALIVTDFVGGGAAIS